MPKTQRISNMLMHTKRGEVEADDDSSSNIFPSQNGEAKFVTQKLNPFDAIKHGGKTSQIGKNNRGSSAVYADVRYDTNGVACIEQVTIDQREKNGSQYGSASFDGLVFRKFKRGEDKMTRLDAKGKPQQRFSFFVKLSLVAQLLSALEKIWAKCKVSKLPELTEMREMGLDINGEYDISTAAENIYTDEIFRYVY